jgi:hypothetical protein
MTANGHRVRAEILHRLYGQPFGSDDVIGLVNDMQAVDDALGAEMLWTVSDQVPLADLPAILDGVIPPKRKDDGVHDRNNWDAGSFYSRILVRA